MQKSYLKILSLLLFSSLLSGCASLENWSANKSSDGTSSIDEKGDPVVNLVNTEKSQKTLRYEAKYDVGEALCTVQSNNHVKQQSLVTLPPPIVIENGVIKQLPAQYQTVVNNPNALPFNMVACIEEMMRMPFERLASLAVDKTFGLLTLGVKGFAAVEVAKHVLDKGGVKGDNNTIYTTNGVGDINANEDLGGIPLNPADVEPITIGAESLDEESTGESTGETAEEVTEEDE